MSAAISQSDPETGRQAGHSLTSHPAGDSSLQRAAGAARVALTVADGRPRLSDLAQSSPCRALLPHIDGRRHAEVVFANTAGGVAGGDRLRWEFAVDGATAGLATTQAAEKVYRALDTDAQIDTRLRARDGAMIEWLPQETILFDGARLDRRTDIDLSPDSRLLALECLVFGRAGHGETLRTGRLRDAWRVRVDDRLVWADSLRLDGAMGDLLGRRSLLDGARACATLIQIGPASALAENCARIREAVQPDPAIRIGAGIVGPVLVCRLLAPAASTVRRAVAVLLALLRQGTAAEAVPLPRQWLC